LSSYVRKFRAFLRKNETARGLFMVGVIILGAVAVWGGIRLALNTEYPVLVVSSGSMCPPESCTLPLGAMIIIRGQRASSILAGPPCGQQAVGPGIGSVQLGSIIVFRPYSDLPDYLVVHRVREISTANGQPVFKTEGDNWHTNSSCDGWALTESNIVGVYQYTVPIPYVGTIVLDIRDFMFGSSCDYKSSCQLTSQGWLVIIALIASLIALEVIEPSKKPEKQASQEHDPFQSQRGTPASPPT
jgi:hypothetical protein